MSAYRMLCTVHQVDTMRSRVWCICMCRVSYVYRRGDRVACGCVHHTPRACWMHTLARMLVVVRGVAIASKLMAYQLFCARSLALSESHFGVAKNCQLRFAGTRTPHARRLRRRGAAAVGSHTTPWTVAARGRARRVSARGDHRYLLSVFAAAPCTQSVTMSGLP